MYALSVLEHTGIAGWVWTGRFPSQAPAPRAADAKDGTKAPAQPVLRRSSAARAAEPKRCYTGEDGTLREATVHDPRLRYPHSYTRRDIALALAAAED